MKKQMKSAANTQDSGAIYANLVPMHQWAQDDLPTFKLFMKGSASLSDAELLSIIIGTGPTDDNSLGISRDLMSKIGNSLCELWKLDYGDLRRLSGINDLIVARISAMFALSRRRLESEVIRKDKITTSQDAYQLLNSLIGDLPYEEFWVLMMNRANKVIRKAKISEGGISGTVVDPKKVYRMCLEMHTTSIILGHNHPSGNISPSEADISITKKLKDSGFLLEITVLDHLIIGDQQYYSFADEGKL